MPNPLINVGSAANDGTGELGPRAWLQKINRLPVPDSTINAGSGDYTGTTEQKITAAIAAAVAAGMKYVWVPQSMLPYNASLVTFDGTVVMLREGGPTEMLDVLAYGADPTGVASSRLAIQTASNHAIRNTAVTNATPFYSNVGSSNRPVFFPAGKYGIDATLSFSVNANQQGVVLCWVGATPSEVSPGGINGEPGPGWGAQLNYTATSGDLLFMGLGASAGNSRIRFECRWLGFVGNKNVGGVTAGGGLHFQSLVITGNISTVFYSVRAMSAKDNGIWIDGPHNAQWTDVQCNSNGARGLYITGAAAISRESRFTAISCYQNASHGVEVATTAGGGIWSGLTAILNTGQGVIFTSGPQTVYGLQLESNSAAPHLDLNSAGCQVFGLMLRYGGGPYPGVRFNSNACVLYGFQSDSLAAQTDLSFTASSHSNEVSGWAGSTTDFKLATHVSDAGNSNTVRAGGAAITGGLMLPVVALAWGASVAINAGASDTFFLTATSNIAATLATPGNPPPAYGLDSYTQRIRLTILNSSGGALSTPVAFSAAYKTSGGVGPANGSRITVDFVYDQANTLWIEASRSAAV